MRGPITSDYLASNILVCQIEPTIKEQAKIVRYTGTLEGCVEYYRHPGIITLNSTPFQIAKPPGSIVYEVNQVVTDPLIIIYPLLTETITLEDILHRKKLAKEQKQRQPQDPLAELKRMALRISR